MSVKSLNQGMKLRSLTSLAARSSPELPETTIICYEAKTDICYGRWVKCDVLNIANPLLSIYISEAHLSSIR